MNFPHDMHPFRQIQLFEPVPVKKRQDKALAYRHVTGSEHGIENDFAKPPNFRKGRASHLTAPPDRDIGQ